MKFLVLIGLLLLSNSIVASEVDYLGYKVRLTPNLQSQSIKGEVTIGFKILDNSLKTLVFPAPNMSIFSVKGDIVNDYKLSSGSLTVSLKNTKSPSKHSITIGYLAKPKLGVNFYPDHFYTAYHTNHWLVAHTDIGDRATIDLTVLVPAKMKVVANGNFVGSEPQGKLIAHHWREWRARPLFTFGFAAGLFKEKKLTDTGVDFHYWYIKATEAEVDRMFADVGAAHQFMVEVSGQPLSQSRYTYVVTEGRAMQEASGFSLVSREFLRHTLAESKESWLLTHELAHEWWGNGISAGSWSDFWLNEGLVQFLVAAFKERRFGRAEYDREMVLFKESIQRQLKKTPVLAEVSPQRAISFEQFSKQHRRVAYSKGAYIFHMLRLELGDAIFWQGLKRYSQMNWEQVVDSQDLKKAFEKVAGRKLDNFFNTWVFEPQDLDISAETEYANEVLTVKIVQNQQNLKEFPLWLAFDDSAKMNINKITVNQRTQGFKFNVSQAPEGIWLDYLNFLPQQIKGKHPLSLLKHNIFNTDATLTRYWAAKALIQSDYCQSNPTAVTDTLKQLGKIDDSRIIQQALGWWKGRCSSTSLKK